MQRTLMFVALAAATATASAANLPAILSGHDWAAINQAPARLMHALRGDRNLDCRLEHYAGGSTLDCVARQPLRVLGLAVEEFYLLHNTNGERMLKLVSPAGVAAVRRAAHAHFPQARLVSTGVLQWKADLGGKHELQVSQRNDLAGELAFVNWMPLAPGARKAGASIDTGVLEGAIRARGHDPLRVCAVNAEAGPSRCVAVPVGSNHYRIDGLHAGSYFAIGYASNDRWHPAHAHQWSNCKPTRSNDCTNGILKALRVNPGEVVHAALNHAFTQLPGRLRQAPINT
ncbi:MAG: hypothetical protein KGQ84_01675 [Proteobacteria bacterium]|nr:hypothetical protein [Pseudomonadota bacterium]